MEFESVREDESERKDEEPEPNLADDDGLF